MFSSLSLQAPTKLTYLFFAAYIRLEHANSSIKEYHALQYCLISFSSSPPDFWQAFRNVNGRQRANLLPYSPTALYIESCQCDTLRTNGSPTCKPDWERTMIFMFVLLPRSRQTKKYTSSARVWALLGLAISKPRRTPRSFRVNIALYFHLFQTTQGYNRRR